eukprot:scaffold18057_cov101-Isochrysis_galbana.AAC.1
MAPGCDRGGPGAAPAQEACRSSKNGLSLPRCIVSSARRSRRRTAASYGAPSKYMPSRSRCRAKYRMPSIQKLSRRLVKAGVWMDASTSPVAST